jgi:hypothetical protein
VSAAHAIDSVSVTIEDEPPVVEVDAGGIDILGTLDELEDVVGRLCGGVVALVVALDAARHRLAEREPGR